MEQQVKFEDLPGFVSCPDCPNPHLLTLNRQLDGQWAIAYVDMSTGNAIGGLALNDSDDIQQATDRMTYALLRFMKRNGGHYGTPRQIN